MLLFPYLKMTPLFKRAYANRSYYLTYTAYGASAFLLIVYITEWKRFARFIPGLSAQIKEKK